MIALLQQTHHRRQYRGHARGCRDCPLAAFECGNTIFKCGHCRIREARIDVAGFITSKSRRRLCRAVIDETRRRENGFTVLQLSTATLTAANTQRLNASALQVR